MRAKCCWKPCCPFRIMKLSTLKRRQKHDTTANSQDEMVEINCSASRRSSDDLRAYDNFLSSDPEVSTTDGGFTPDTHLPSPVATRSRPTSTQDRQSDSDASPKSIGSLRLRLAAYGKMCSAGSIRLNLADRAEDNDANRLCGSSSSLRNAHNTHSPSKTSRANGLYDASCDHPTPKATFCGVSGLDGNERRFRTALKAIEPPVDWVEVSACRKAKVKAYYKHTPGDNFGWVWMALELDHSLVQSMALGNELDLWSKWNKVVTSNELLEPQKSVYTLCNRWKRSLALGLYKTDTLNSMQRYLNHEQGYYLEHIVPVDANQSCYVAPQKGYYRELLESSLLLVPISGGKTLWVSNTKADFPIGMNAWLARQVIPTIAREIATSVTNGVKQVGDSERGRPWAERIAADSSGLYAEMAALAKVTHQYNINNLPSASSFSVPVHACV